MLLACCVLVLKCARAGVCSRPGTRRQSGETHLLQAPLPHHEGIVHRQAIDFIDATRFDSLVVLLIPGQVGGGASRRKGAGKGEEDHTLALHQVLGLDIFPRERVVPTDRIVAHTALERDLVPQTQSEANNVRVTVR